LFSSINLNRPCYTTSKEGKLKFFLEDSKVVVSILKILM
jgi:hypothetical protein